MARSCLVCQRREDRPRIDAQLQAGTSLTLLATATGLSEDSLRRHQKNHLPRPAGADGDLLVARMEEVFLRVEKHYQSSAAAGDDKSAVTLLKQLKDIILAMAATQAARSSSSFESLPLNLKVERIRADVELSTALHDANVGAAIIVLDDPTVTICPLCHALLHPHLAITGSGQVIQKSAYNPPTNELSN